VSASFGNGVHLIIPLLTRIAVALEKIAETMLTQPPIQWGTVDPGMCNGQADCTAVRHNVGCASLPDLGPMTTSPPLGDIPGVEDIPPRSS
jgi:hypothetical protein